jgi:hypothetical protein
MRPRWPDLVDAAVDLVLAQPRIQADGDRPAVEIRRRGEIHQRPTGEVVSWMRAGSRKGDGFVVLLLQWDVWAADYPAVVEIETALMQALDWNTCREVNGLRMTSEHDEDRDHEDSEDEATHTSIDFRMEAVWKR